MSDVKEEKKSSERPPGLAKSRTASHIVRERDEKDKEQRDKEKHKDSKASDGSRLTRHKSTVSREDRERAKQDADDKEKSKRRMERMESSGKLRDTKTDSKKSPEEEAREAAAKRRADRSAILQQLSDPSTESPQKPKEENERASEPKKAAEEDVKTASSKGRVERMESSQQLKEDKAKADKKEPDKAASNDKEKDPKDRKHDGSRLHRHETRKSTKDDKEKDRDDKAPKSAMKSIPKSDSEKKVAIAETADQEDIRRMREALQRQLKAVQEADARLKEMEGKLLQITQFACPKCNVTSPLDMNAVLEEKGVKFTPLSSPVVPPLTASVSNVSNDLLKRFDEQQIVRAQKVARKWLLRHRFMKIAKGFKKSGASLVLRLRNETLKEIIASERSYVNSLSVVTQIYMIPLEQAARHAKKKILSRQDVYDLFSNMELIMDFHNELLRELETRQGQWPVVTHFGDIFLKMAPIMKLYSMYVRNFDRAQVLLQQLKKSNARFLEFIHNAEKRPEVAGQTLESFLIMPVQRLPRYQMLLQTLIKYTSAEHVDMANLQDALAKVKAVIEAINARTREEQDRVAMLALEKQLGEELAEEGRVPVWDGPVSHEGELYHLFVMNDLLVLAKPEKGLFKDSERKFKIRKKHNLDMIGVKEGDKDTVDLHCNVREPLAPRFVFVVADNTHRMQLLGKLKELAETPVEQASPLASEGSSSMLRERSGTSSPGVKSPVGSSDSLISRDRSGTSSHIFRSSVGAADQSVLPRERSGTASNTPNITPKSSVGAVNAPLVAHKTSSNLTIDSARGSGSGSKINGSKIVNTVSPRGSVGAANPPSPAGKRE